MLSCLLVVFTVFVVVFTGWLAGAAVDDVCDEAADVFAWLLSEEVLVSGGGVAVSSWLAGAGVEPDNSASVWLLSDTGCFEELTWVLSG